MSPRGALSERLRASGRRIVFVVGKGGVGKTTTAAALALDAADAGSATHLLSTDPAHSLGDVFGLELPAGGPRPGACSPALTLEELDARAYAHRRLAGMAGAVTALLERGTYLDAQDADSLAQLSLPGVDELMGALRLVELADGPARRIVVDTAPTGHALRMLDAGRLIAGWVAALDAMADKARAVGSALLGLDVPAPGEAVLAELRGQVERFRAEVLGRAGFVVVTRPGAVVRAETGRLLEELRRRGLALEAVVVTGGESGGGWAVPGAPLELSVPLTAPAPRGCQALRAWGAAAPPAGPGTAQGDVRARAQDSPGTGAGEAARRLAALPQSLFLLAGKGGVGKSTCASALALELANARSVVLLSTDPAGSLTEVLGAPVTAEGVRLDGLWARQVDAAAELERVREEYRREVGAAFHSLGSGSAAALDRAVLETLWGLAPPGVDELLATVRILRDLESGATVVIDPAPTGHFLRLLEMPEIALDWTHALMRLILKYHLARELDGITRDSLQFARDLKEFLARLRDPAGTAAFVVTLDEPVVAAETRRLLAALDRAGVPVAGQICNRAEAGPPRDDGGAASGDARAGAVPRPPLILAPLLPSSPIGPEALRAFVRRWEIVP